MLHQALENGFYIIGNGFDIHHGLQTSYQKFAEWLKLNNQALYDKCLQYLMDESTELWNEFEDCFSNIDYSAIYDEAADFLYSYGAEGWSDSYHHDYQYEIKQITNALSTDLMQAFAEWITDIDNRSFPLVNNINKISLNNNAHYLSFNYTSTLTKAYEIPPNQIKHIHGACGQDDIILGHAFKVVPDQFTKEIDEDTDPRIADGCYLVQNYFKQTLKPTQRIIAENDHYFDQLKYASKVFVLGHSMSEVDMPYFERIVIATSNVPWTVSYYNDEARIRLETILDNLGLKDFSLHKINEITF